MVVENLQTQSQLALTLGDSNILEKLHGVLISHNVNTEIAQQVRSQLMTMLGSPVDNTSTSKLHKITTRCTKCPLMNHDAVLPMWNVDDPDVLFILETPGSFSIAGKDLFVSSLVTAGFKSDKCCVTYLTRCSKNNTITPEEINNCSDYLYTEIQLIKPKLIVPFGANAVRSLLGSSVKLNTKTINPEILWLGPWATLPIISPNYAVYPKNNLQAEFKSLINFAYNFLYGTQ